MLKSWGVVTHGHCGHDDVFIVGGPESAIEVATLLKAEGQRVGLDTQDKKLKMWCRSNKALGDRALAQVSQLEAKHVEARRVLRRNWRG